MFHNSAHSPLDQSFQYRFKNKIDKFEMIYLKVSKVNLQITRNGL